MADPRFLRSTIAAYTSQFARLLLRVSADIALAKLILPEAHGLFAMALLIVTLAGFFRDLGLPYQLLRDPRRPYGSVLAWEIASGTFVMLLLVIAAPLSARFDPATPALLRALAPFVLLEGLSVVPRLYFERELRIDRLVVPEIARSLGYAVVAIGLAWSGAGIHSFVVAELVALALLGGLLWWQARGRIELHFEPAIVRDLIRQSIFLFFVALASNAIPALGRLVVGALDGTLGLAAYDKAVLWGLRLQTVIVPALARVLYPTLIEYRDNARLFAGVYRVSTVSILSLETLLAYFVYLNAELVMTRVLADEHWIGAVPLLRVLVFMPLVEPFNRLGGELLKVRRDDRAWFGAVLLNLACLVVFGWLLTSRYGALGMAWANFLLLGNVILAWRIFRICGQRKFLELCRDLAQVYLIPLPFFLLAGLFPPVSWERFGASLGASVLAGLALAWRFYGPARAFLQATRGAGRDALEASSATPGTPRP